METEDYDNRINEFRLAYTELEAAAFHMREATVSMRGILPATTWKRMDKMLGDLQKIEYDVGEWMIKNGIR